MNKESLNISLVKNPPPYPFLTSSPDLNSIVFSSRADGKTTPFSDYDYVVLYNSINTPKNKLNSFIKRQDLEIIQCDPLQHHSAFLIDLENKENFNNGDLPLLVFNDTCFSTSCPVVEFFNINPTSTQSSLLKNCDFTIKFLQSQINNISNLNPYIYKCVIGSFFILPVYFLQLNGVYQTKPYILHNKLNYLPRHICEIIDKATVIRANWQTPKIYFVLSKIFKTLNINPKYYRKLVKHLPIKNPNTNTISKQEISYFINYFSNELHSQRP